MCHTECGKTKSLFNTACDITRVELHRVLKLPALPICHSLCHRQECRVKSDLTFSVCHRPHSACSDIFLAVLLIGYIRESCFIRNLVNSWWYIPLCIFRHQFLTIVRNAAMVETVSLCALCSNVLHIQQCYKSIFESSIVWAPCLFMPGPLIMKTNYFTCHWHWKWCYLVRSVLVYSGAYSIS